MDHVKPAEVIVCHTLIDITNTGVVGNFKANLLPFVDKSGKKITDLKSWQYSRNQQRNFESILQVVGLRAQPYIVTEPNKVEIDLRAFSFGSAFSGRQSVWMFKFFTEQKDAFDIGTQKLAGLINDFNSIPIIPSLEESVPLAQPVFFSTGDSLNIYFEIMK